jgi:demethylmenaquinone methyltransferase/2-methoxy-6-polyprenyl-1,4-benzoquinol methylase
LNTEDLIAAQIDYYRARAASYDQEVERATELAPGYADAFRHEAAAIASWLAADPPRGHVLEIAAGSGNRTTGLLRSAERVTALDAAPEMLALLAAKHPDVETIEADVFSWQPPQRYDHIFMGYWITHVPAACWERFWSIVDDALAPDGRVWFMDNAHPDYANSHGPGDWPVAAGLRLDDRTEGEVQTRTLDDGRSFTMVKRFWWPGELTASLGRLGWLAEVDHTRFAFIYGTARRD